VSGVSSVPRRSIGRRLAGTLGTLLGIAAITFLLGELATRFVLGIRPLDDAPSIYTADPRLGWRHRAGGAGDFVKLGARQHIEINSHGLREREIPPGEHPGMTRVLVLGDSAVAGLEVPPEKVWTRVAEDALRARGRSVQFVNAGVRGWGTDQSLLFLQDEGMRYRPDLVLYFWNDNDVDDNETIHRPFRRYGKAFFDVASDGALLLRGVPVPEYEYARNLRVGPDGQPQEQPVPASVRAQMWLRDQVVMKTAFGTAMAHLVAAIPQLTDKLVRSSGWSDFQGGQPAIDHDARLFRVNAAMLREMDATARAGGAEFQMVGSDGPAAHWANALREQVGLQSLDDYQAFFAHMPKGTKFLVPFDSHWNETGHRIYGELLAELLDRSTLLDPKPAVSAP